MTLCKQIFEEDTENVQVYDLMLQVYSSTGKYQEGLKFAKEAVNKFPNESDMVGYMGEFYEHLENIIRLEEELASGKVSEEK